VPLTTQSPVAVAAAVLVPEAGVWVGLTAAGVAHAVSSSEIRANGAMVLARRKNMTNSRLFLAVIANATTSANDGVATPREALYSVMPASVVAIPTITGLRSRDSVFRTGSTLDVRALRTHYRPTRTEDSYQLLNQANE